MSNYQYNLNANNSSIINLNNNTDDGINLISQQITNDHQSTTSISRRLNPFVFSSNQNQQNISGNVDYQNLNIRNQQVNKNYSNISQIQGQQQNNSMSQTAQIVLLPTQNLNIATSHQMVPKQQQQQEHVQMILPNNDVGSYQIAAFPNVRVLVPTTILITDKNECILIPQQTSQNICQTNIPLQVASTSTQILNTSSSESSYETNNADYEDEDCPQQFTQEQECEFITLANTATQTVIAGIPNENETAVNQTATHQLIGNNCQIVGIIHGGTNQIGILQQNSEPNTDPNQQVLLTACIETAEGDNINQINNSNQQQSTETIITTTDHDVNTFLASTIASGASSMEKSDPNQAKEWLKDSFIVNRALKALKRASNSHHQRSHQHHNRPHHQQHHHQVWR